MSTNVCSIAEPKPSEDLLAKVNNQYITILADPPWQFQNRTGKMAPEHRRLLRYPTMELYDLVETCSPGPYLELFARFKRHGWNQWGNENVEENSLIGVARRKGHENPQLRLLENPACYSTN